MRKRSTFVMIAFAACLYSPIWLQQSRGENTTQESNVSRIRKFLYVANYDDATIRQYQIRSDGTLSPLSPVEVASDASNVGIVILAKNAPFAYYMCEEARSISQFRILKSGALEALNPPSVPAGESFVLLFSKNGRYAYIYDNTNGAIRFFNVGKDGVLYPSADSRVVSAEAVEFKIHPSAKFLYISAEHQVLVWPLNQDGSLARTSQSNVRITALNPSR